MRLSEAIRLGSMLRPQVRGGLYSVRDVIVPGDILGLKQERAASCAMGAAYGAAYEAVGATCRQAIAVAGGKPFRGEASAVGAAIQVIDTPHEWLPILWLTTACPVCERIEEVLRIIAHLNDDHEWARERIADFVATVESPQSVDAVDPSAPDMGTPTTRV